MTHAFVVWFSVKKSTGQLFTFYL